MAYTLEIGDELPAPPRPPAGKRVTLSIDRDILQCAIDVIARGGCEYIAWIDTLSKRDAYNVALLIGVLLEADAHGRFQA